MDSAVAQAQEGCMINMGQTCVAATRTYVHEKIYDEFVKKTAELATKRKVGDPFSPDTVSGPQVRNVCLLVGCLTSQQHASVSQGRIFSDNCTCCHTEIDIADQTFHLPLSQYTDTGPTSPSTGPITPDAWQGSHWSANFEVTGRPGKAPAQAGLERWIFRSRGGRLNH